MVKNGATEPCARNAGTLCFVSSDLEVRWLITGANGHLGRQIVNALGREHEILALVRSESAASALRDLPCQVLRVDYQAPVLAAQHIADRWPGAWDALIGLTGTIKGKTASDYHAAHETVSDFLVAITEQVEIGQMVSLSIAGADAGASNLCFASRGAADDRLTTSGRQVAILRLPMILGRDDYASGALMRKGSARWVFSFRVESLEQPIAATDVIKVIEAIIDKRLQGVFSLGGPETLSRRQLIQRAGALLGRAPVILNLPISLGFAITALLAWLSPSAPVSPSMLGVLDHDDVIDNEPLLSTLGISLEPLDTTLRRVLKPMNEVG